MKKKNLIALVVLLAGCGSATPTGELEVRLQAEDTITAGLSAGTADEEIVDGWAVAFDRYVMVVGDVRIEGGGDGTFSADSARAVDLAQLPEGGLQLISFDRVPAGLWPEVSFTTPIATAETGRGGTSLADIDRMIAEGCTYLIVGTITNPAGQRCVRGDDTMCTPATSIDFDLCVPAPTRYGPCESDTGIEGVVVAAGTTTSVSFTIHGDHLFFNGFPAGAEGTVARRAQWLANSDVDADGTVTRADLESIGASDLGQLFPSDPGDGMPGYALGNAPIPLMDAWDFVVGELMTQGHFQGEGECPSSAL